MYAQGVAGCTASKLSIKQGWAPSCGTGTAWEGGGVRGSPGQAVLLAASQESIMLFSPWPLLSFRIDSPVGRWRQSFLMSAQPVHMYSSVVGQLRTMWPHCAQKVQLLVQGGWQKKELGAVPTACGGGRSGRLDPCLAGWGLVCNGGGSLEQLQLDEILGDLWEAVLALHIEDSIGRVLDRESMQLGDKVCKLSVLIHPGLWLGVLLFEMNCVCLVLQLPSGGHVMIAVMLESRVTLQVLVTQGIVVLPEWAWVAVFTPEEVLHPLIRVGQSGVDGVTGLITKVAL
jgi:hypothetical protein